jgi:hypothetical protein
MVRPARADLTLSSLFNDKRPEGRTGQGGERHTRVLEEKVVLGCDAFQVL